MLQHNKLSPQVLPIKVQLHAVKHENDKLLYQNYMGIYRVADQITGERISYGPEAAPS
jgi:hypothetical protein